MVYKIAKYFQETLHLATPLQFIKIEDEDQDGKTFQHTSDGKVGGTY